MIMTVFMVILKFDASRGNTKVLLSTRLMIDLDTPADLLVLSKDAPAKKSVSYLRKITKNHLAIFSSRRGKNRNEEKKEPTKLIATVMLV